ncbi:scavenger receptor class F member 1-like isoform X2 [Haliotis asinina]
MVTLAPCFDPDLLCFFLVFVISSTVCEVCKPGRFGGNCSKVCPSECKDGLCQPSGLCEDCSDGFYGISCEKRCPSTCPDNTCHRFNVSCKKECSEGWHGKKCDKQCPRCPGPCHRWSGECTGKSSNKTDLSSMDPLSASESHPADDRRNDHTLPLAIGIPVAILVVVVPVGLIQWRRLCASNSGADHRNVSKESDVSSEPLLKI